MTFFSFYGLINKFFSTIKKIYIKNALLNSHYGKKINSDVSGEDREFAEAGERFAKTVIKINEFVNKLESSGGYGISPNSSACQLSQSASASSYSKSRSMPARLPRCRVFHDDALMVRLPLQYRARVRAAL
jgi:hypothetical protein